MLTVFWQRLSRQVSVTLTLASKHTHTHCTTRRFPWANRYLALGGKEEASLRQTTMISLPDTLPPLGVPLQYLFLFLPLSIYPRPPPLHPPRLYHRLSFCRPLHSSSFFPFLPPSCHLRHPRRIRLPPSLLSLFIHWWRGLKWQQLPPHHHCHHPRSWWEFRRRVFALHFALCARVTHRTVKRVGGARDMTTSVICQSDLAPFAIYLPDATRAKSEGEEEQERVCEKRVRKE